MTLRAVVFDLDGVLVDTERLQYEAWKSALDRHHVRLSPGDYSRVAGQQSDSIAEQFVRTYGVGGTAEDLLSAKKTLLTLQGRTTTK